MSECLPATVELSRFIRVEGDPALGERENEPATRDDSTVRCSNPGPGREELLFAFLFV